MRPVDRSMNTELTQGMVDGKLRCSSPNRGGEVEHVTNAHRTTLSFENYGERDGQVSPSSQRPDVVGFLP